MEVEKQKFDALLGKLLKAKPGEAGDRRDVP
jgi:hypothetical protein